MERVGFCLGPGGKLFVQAAAETLRHGTTRRIGTLDLSLSLSPAALVSLLTKVRSTHLRTARALGTSAHPRAAGRREVGRDELGVEDVDLRVVFGFGIG